MKRWLLLALKLVLTAACLGWALRGVGAQGLERLNLAEVEWPWVAAGLVCAGLTVVLTGLRLVILLRAQEIRLGLGRATELSLIGNLFSLFAVGGIGADAAKIFLLIRDHPGRKLAVTMTVMFDHLVGLVAMSLVFFALTAGRFDALASQSVETRAMLRFAWVFFAGGLVMVGLMFVAAYPPVDRWIHRRGRLKAEIFRQLPLLYDAYRREWRLALAALAVAAVMLPIYYATFWCAARAVGSEVAAGPVLVAMPVVDMLSALPVSIAGIGVREASMKVLMADLTGMEAGVAVAASMLGFLLTIAWALVGAVFFLRPRDRRLMRELSAEAKHDAPST